VLVRYTSRRLLLLIPVLLGIGAVVFLLIHLIPGDPAQVMLGSEYDPVRAASLRQELGLNAPLPVQFAVWLGNMARGDFGRSIFTHDPVLSLIVQRMALTGQLAVSSMAIAVAIGLPTGIVSAMRRRGMFDVVSRVLSTIGIAVPVFWSGILLMLLFGLYLRWLPAGGGPSQYGIKALVLPSVVLGLWVAALLVRMTRSSLLQILTEPYIVTAHAKGLARRLVYFRHALKNALIPIITIVGLEFGGLLGGAVLTERIFSLPGLGSLLIESIYRRDFPVIQGAVLVVALWFVLINLLVDLAYAVADPRVLY